jgi:hypothetical protein
VSLRHVKHLAGELDRMGEPRLADLRAVRPPERSKREMFGVPARRLRAGSGRKMRTCGLGARPFDHLSSLLAESTRRVGTAWPARGLKAASEPVNRAGRSLRALRRRLRRRSG